MPGLLIFLLECENSEFVFLVFVKTCGEQDIEMKEVWLWPLCLTR